MPEKSPAWVLYAGLWAGFDYWTLPGKLVSVLLRRDMSADSGLLCHAKTVEECKIVVSASWMDFIHCAYRHNSVKGEFSGASPRTIRHELRQSTYILWAPRPAVPGNVAKENLPEQSVILSERKRVEGSTHFRYGIRSNRRQDPSTTLGMTRFS